MEGGEWVPRLSDLRRCLLLQLAMLDQFVERAPVATTDMYVVTDDIRTECQYHPAEGTSLRYRPFQNTVVF